MRLQRVKIALLATLLMTGCSQTMPLKTVASVDLQRYQGVWHEIGRLPNRFQAFCAKDIQATYTLNDDRVDVLNQCRDGEGELRSALGKAYPVAGTGNAQLRVSFFWPFFGDYQVMELDPDYQWVLVGAPSREYLWILARSQQLPETTRNQLLAAAKQQGFDLQQWQWSAPKL